MAARRRIQPAEGQAAIRGYLRRVDMMPSLSPADLPRDILATAVRFALEELAARVPGHSVEVRVPPFGAIQMIPGQRHTRGTPPAVVQTDPLTFLALVTGHGNWSNGIERGFIKASGQGADLSTYLPLDKLLDERG